MLPIVYISTDIWRDRSKLKISNYSFNPHIIPTYRGIISSIYIDVKQNNIAGRFFKILKVFIKRSILFK